MLALPKEPQKLYVSSWHSLPIRLTTMQFLWAMELLVGLSVLASVLVLYFLPVYLGQFWIRNCYPVMTLVGPTEEVIKQSLLGLRFLSMFTQTN